MNVDWIPKEVLMARGKLGLMQMPGYRDALADDLDSLKVMGVGLIVCLQQPDEFRHSQVPELEGEREAAIVDRQMHFYHDPVSDFGVPGLLQAQNLVNRINAELDQGNTVAMHCFAGLGRAGTIASCVLASRGYKPEAAVAKVREYREGAVQTAGQYAFVNRFYQVEQR